MLPEPAVVIATPGRSWPVLQTPYLKGKGVCSEGGDRGDRASCPPFCLLFRDTGKGLLNTPPGTWVLGLDPGGVMPWWDQGGIRHRGHRVAAGAAYRQLQCQLCPAACMPWPHQCPLRPRQLGLRHVRSLVPGHTAAQWGAGSQTCFTDCLQMSPPRTVRAGSEMRPATVGRAWVGPGSECWGLERRRGRSALSCRTSGPCLGSPAVVCP